MVIKHQIRTMTAQDEIARAEGQGALFLESGCRRQPKAVQDTMLKLS